MDLVFLIAKVVTVILFLVMFLRSSRVIWGIGLLTVTTAILLDAFLGTFGREDMLEQFGFFFYVLAGGLFAGATLWLWGVLRPYLHRKSEGNKPTDYKIVPASVEPAKQNSSPDVDTQTAEPVVFEIIRDELSREDLMDLAYDLELLEGLPDGTVGSSDSMIQVIIEQTGGEEQLEQLTLAVQRIREPLPVDHLPRIDNIQLDSPPTILRQYMSASCSNSDLKSIASDMSIEWENVSGESVRTSVRNLLMAVDQAGRKEELIDQLRQLSSQASN